MNISFQCIVLLACMAMCTSINIMRCRCLRTSKGVKPSLIADVKVYGVRPYCHKKEVIVILRDERSLCLDPEHKFTKAVVQTIQMQRAARADKMKTTRANTKAAPATVSATLAPTSS